MSERVLIETDADTPFIVEVKIPLKVDCTLVAVEIIDPETTVDPIIILLVVSKTTPFAAAIEIDTTPPDNSVTNVPVANHSLVALVTDPCNTDVEPTCKSVDASKVVSGSAMITSCVVAPVLSAVFRFATKTVVDPITISAAASNVTPDAALIIKDVVAPE